jgi:putative thioredoxin
VRRTHCKQPKAEVAAGLGALVDQVLAVELAQPVQGERWPGTVTQQPLAPGTVSGGDAHRGIDGELAAAGDYARARPELLAIVRTDRKFRDDAGRRTALTVFAALPADSDLVRRYRRELAAALN